MNGIEAIGALHDPLRQRLYEFVAAQGRDVSRHEAAEACGIQRTLAAFHLDKLVEAGLLETSYRRLSGRAGPGAGRPAKLYRRTTVEHLVSVPPRAYDLASSVLAEALERAGADRELAAAAHQAGHAIGASASDEPLGDVLRRQGYEPYDDNGEVRLRNCPFHQIAERFPPLVCGMNLALCEGVLAGMGVADRRARLDPHPGECCVVIGSKNSRT